MKTVLSFIVTIVATAWISGIATAGVQCGNGSIKQAGDCLGDVGSDRSDGQQQCTNKCKLTLFDAEFEFNYHSGASAVNIAYSIQQACGHTASQTCKIEDPRENGSIVYLEWAGCVFEKTKQSCKQEYDQNRPY